MIDYRWAALLASLSLAGCATPLEDVRQQPIRLTIIVPAAWDRTGTCLAAAYNQYDTVYLPVPSEQRAEVIVNLVTTGLLGSIKRTLFVFDIKGGNQTTVTWRRDDHLSSSFEQEARERIERCGKT